MTWDQLVQHLRVRDNALQQLLNSGLQASEFAPPAEPVPSNFFPSRPTQATITHQGQFVPSVSLEGQQVLQGQVLPEQVLPEVFNNGLGQQVFQAGLPDDFKLLPDQAPTPSQTDLQRLFGSLSSQEGVPSTPTSGVWDFRPSTPPSAPVLELSDLQQLFNSNVHTTLQTPANQWEIVKTTSVPWPTGAPLHIPGNQQA